MPDLELPLKKRSKLYRFFEMVPALISYGAIIILVVLSFINPLLAAIYLLLITVTVLVKAAGIAYHMLTGQRRLRQAEQTDWRALLDDLEDPTTAKENYVQPRSADYAATQRKPRNDSRLTQWITRDHQKYTMRLSWQRTMKPTTGTL